MRLGTWLFTLFYGKKVGADAFGNVYYRSSKCQGKEVGRAHTERRWVAYKGLAEPSKVPAAWHGWLHHMTDEIPTSNDATNAWKQPHRPNFTGTDHAYFPPGHENAGGKRDKATGDYQPWQPKQS